MEGLEAKIKLTAPREKGKLPSVEDVITTLKEREIVYGIDEKVIIEAILNKKYNIPIVVARAKKPTKGEPALYAYKFEEAIDVIEGQILAIKEPPKIGEPGISVFDKEIPGIPGDDFQIIAGKNTYLEERGRILYATGCGEVFWKENRCDVERVLRIIGDLTENIDFDGKVIVSGSICEGISVKAKDVEVNGSIRKGGTIISKGTINVAGDIIGDENKRVEIKAERDIMANSATYADISAKGSVVMKTGLLHSNTKTEDAVIIGRKGVIMTSLFTLPPIFSLPIVMAVGIKGIIGGTTYGKKSISSEVIGSPSQEKTEIIVDTDGIISCSSSIYPKTKVTIGRASLEIKNIIETTALKEDRGGIIQTPYQQKEAKLVFKEENKRKPDVPPSILVKNIEEGRAFLGINDIDFLEIPLVPTPDPRLQTPDSRLLCFPKETRGPWDVVRKREEGRMKSEEEKNGEMEVLNQGDGLFVKIAPPGIKGKPVTLIDAKERLKEFFSIDENALQEAIDKKDKKPVKIGERQYIPSLDGKIIIRTNGNKEAYISLTPPNPNLGKTIKGGAILKEIEKNNIKFGEDKLAIKGLIKNPVYNKEIAIARCKEPTKGESATYLYKFKETLEVIDGQILAIKEVPKIGEPGISIFGDEIPGLLGDDFELIPGINTYLSDDGKILYATKRGGVSWNENKCDVQRILNIDGDLKEDVKFDGKVIISKDIGDGISLEGDEIFVKGNVGKGVFIVSNGRVEIEGDILGAENQRVSIKAECDCLANSGTYSDIEAGGSVIMKTGLSYSNTKTNDCAIIGRKGLIMTSCEVLPQMFSLPVVIEKGVKGIVGGKVYAKNSISSETIGSVLQEKTEIITGEGGFVSSMSIYPKTKISIGKVSNEIKKIIEHVTFREERGVLSQFPYEKKELTLKFKKFEQKKPESPPSVLVKNIEEGKTLLGMSEIDFFKIPNPKSQIRNPTLFLCFPKERAGAWEAIRKKLEEERRMEEEKDGEMEILNQMDGLFVIIRPAGIRGNPVSLEDAKGKLKDFFDYNENILQGAIEKKEANPVRIGQRQYIPEFDGKISIKIIENKEAYLISTSPHPILGMPIRAGVIIKELLKNNIKYGENKKVLANFLKSPIYNKEILIASYKPPTKGESAKLIYQFGIVEGKEIKKEDMLEVIEGQILAIKESPKIGEPGVSITGCKIEGTIGDDFEITPGINTYLSQDGRVLYAQERGEALWTDLRCDVEKVLRISGDCGEDIDFPGKVIVSGNVGKRTTIIAQGDIIIKGQVELGANLTSGGSIYIDKSLFGQKGEEISIKAKEDIVCESCEMTNISAGGVLLVRIFLNGNVRTKKVFIQGRRGVIMTKGEVPPPIFTLPVVIAKGKKTFEGGRIFASELVDTEEMGSSEMTETEIEVGENGAVSISGTIFPNSKIKIGKQTLRITKPLIGSTFRYKEGRIRESPYESFPVEMTKKEITIRKKMKVEPPASIVITQQSLLDAISDGARFLKIKEEMLEFSLLLEEKPNKTIRLYPSSMFGPWSEDWDATYGEDKDGSFSFDNRADGLYLLVHPPYGEGKFVVYEDVLLEIKKEGFIEIDNNVIKGLFKEYEEKHERKERDCKIGPRQYLSDVSKIIKIKIKEDGCAEAIFYPPMIGGMLIDMDEVIKFIHNEGIVAGIDHNAIKDALVNERFKEPIIIVSPIPAKPGKDAELEYKIKPKEEITFSPDSEGRVDFKELGLITSVKKGDVLVIKHPPLPGVSGKKITGEEIPSSPPKDISLPIGKNTKISDDGLSLIADVNGMVVFKKDGKLDIVPLYEVKGDVCLLSGNIHFPGNVIISGSVQEGFIVEVEGDIFIKEGIDGGIVKGGGRIEVGKGVRKGNVKGKTITCGFIENSYITGDFIQVKEAILHSDTLSFDIKAKKIIGGRIFAKDKVEVDEIKNTFVYLGRKPDVIAEIERLKEVLKKEKITFEKLSLYFLQSKKYLDIKHIDMLSLDRKELLKGEYEKKKGELFEIVKRIKDLENMEVNEEAAVFVKNKVYPGTRINILNANFLVLEEKGASLFRLEKGKVLVEKG